MAKIRKQVGGKKVEHGPGDINLPDQLSAPETRQEDPNLLACLDKLGLKPKTITEVGMGVNTDSLEVLVGGLPGLEKYTVVERGGIPETNLAGAMQALGPLWNKVQFESGDYLERRHRSSDLFLFSGLFGTTAYFPMAVIAKAMVETLPGGAVLMRERTANFLKMSRGQIGSIHVYHPEMFETIEDCGLEVRFFYEKADRPEETSLEEILARKNVPSDESLIVVLKNPGNVDGVSVLSSAVILASESIETEPLAGVRPKSAGPVRNLIDQWYDRMALGQLL